MAGSGRSAAAELVIGVLALQGDVEKHIQMLLRCGIGAVRVRTNEELARIHGLVIPGGESTTIGKLMVRYGLDRKIVKAAQNGMPIFGTCAGFILLAKEVIGNDQVRLGLLDVSVIRNAFGRQIESFEADVEIPAIGPPAFRTVFIRAPYAASVSGGVDVLARYDDKIVLVREGDLLGCAFHPELTEDTRIHRYFIDMVNRSRATGPTQRRGKSA